VDAILDSLQASGLPIVLGEVSSNAFTDIPCDPIHYGNLLTRANADGIGYLFWAWYEDGQCGPDMNITVNQDGTTIPTAATPGFGNDALNAPGYGIDTASPPTRKADFSPVVGPMADLELSQAVSANPAFAGKDAVFTMTVTNHGPDSATGVVVHAAYDAAATVIWVSPACTTSTQAIHDCSAGTLANGASMSFKLVLRKDAAGSVFNNAGVTSATADPNAANNAPTLAVTVNPSPVANQVLRYRLYSPVTLEHLYTTDLNEYNTLGSFTGTWNQEGTVGHVLDNPGSFNGVIAVPYYRLYDTSVQRHHWTTDPNEYYTLIQFPQYNAEGVDGYILPTNTTGATQLYRLLYPFVPGLHHWTIDANEYDTLISTYGWVGEGGSGFVIQ
jgi:hypothetical protein